MQNKLRTLWNEDASAINAWLGIPSTITAEIVSRQGFDAITIDLQHGINDYSTAVPMLQAISASDATPMARVPWLEPGIIMKLLDAGALGIICPMINTPEEAERFVRYCRYAPQGDRSFGPVRAGLVHGPDYVKQANDSIVTLAMVETGQAPHYTELAAGLGLTLEEGRQTLHDLIATGVPAWLHPDTDYLVSFPPFNVLPNQYRITVRGEQKWFAQ